MVPVRSVHPQPHAERGRRSPAAAPARSPSANADPAPLDRAVAPEPAQDELDGVLQRAVRERAQTLPGPLLQRKIGFETELMVPSFGPYHGKLTYKNVGAVSDEVASFLDGGVPYGTDIGGKGQSIRLDSDHSDKISRKPIVEKLKTMGYVKGNPKEPKTKLEYVTHAVDELAPGSDDEFVDLITDLQSKLAATVKDAKSGAMHQLAAPAQPGFLTGVPVADLKAWLGPTDYAQIRPLVQDFLNNKTSDSVYLQATVGIIPSGIRKFLGRTALPGGHVELDPPSAARRQVLDIVSIAIADLEKHSAFKKHKWVKSLGAASYESLMGILSLAYMYLLGDTLHKTSGGTNSTVKNAVPFLIKHGPFDLVKLAGTSGLEDNPPPQKLARKIGEIFKKSKYLKPSYWMESGKRSAKGEGRIKRPLEARTKKDSLVKGDYVDVVESFLLGSSKGGGVLAVVGKELPGMDALSRDSGGVDILRESYGQMAIPLEYRWISKQYKIAELDKAMYEIVGDVRIANSVHLEEEDQRKIAAAVRAAPRAAAPPVTT
jgi:hypothetical protein